MSWAEKYRPSTLSEVEGNPSAKKQIVEWAASWKPTSKALLCCGRAGVGKTSALLALASDMSWEVVELNASDQRTADIIDRVVGMASRNATLDPSVEQRLVLLDEADNVHRRADAGGAGAIARAISKTSQPIALIANDCQAVPLSVSSKCSRVMFKKLNSKAIEKVLKRVCAGEGIQADIDALNSIAVGADGDMRGAINDLQAVAEGREHIELSDIGSGRRDVKSDVFKVMNLIFKGTELKEALAAARSIDQTPDDLIYWIDENVPDTYVHADELEGAYSWLSRADVFLGRVRSRQNYGMWRYASSDMVGGVMTAKTEHPHPKRYRPPTYWKVLGRLKRMRGVRDGVARKVGRYTHTSSSYARRELLPFFRLLCENEKMAVGICDALELTFDETAYLLGQDTSKAERVHSRAEKRRALRTEDVIEYFGGFKSDRTAPAVADEGEGKEEKADDALQDETGQKSLFEF